MQKNNAPDSRPPYSALIIFLFFAAGIIAVGYLNYRNYAQQFRSEVEKQLSAIADLKVSELLQWRRARLADAQTLCENSVFAEMVKRFLNNSEAPDSKKNLQAWLAQYQIAYAYEHVFFLDVQGAVRLASPVGSHLNCRLLARQVPEIIRAGTAVFFDLHHHESDKDIHFSVVTPVLDQGRPLGLIVFDIDACTYLYPFLKRWPTPSLTAETLLVRRDGDSALFLNELRFQKDTALKLSIPLSEAKIPAVQAVLGHTGIVEGPDYRGVPVIANVHAVPDSPWFLIARMDIAEVYAPMTERLWFMILLVAALLLGSGLGLLVFWRQQRVRFYRGKLEAQREKAWLQDIISRSLNEIYIFDPETLRLKFANSGALRNIGYTMEELSLLTVLAIKPGHTEATYRAMVRPLLAGEREMVLAESLNRRKDGSTYPVEAHLQVVATGAGTVLLAVVNDITERKQAEEALQQSEAAVRNKLAAILEPEGDIGVLNLADIIDCQALQKIMEDFHRFTNITSAVVDSSGNLLIAVGFQDICTQFHRVHPETGRHCWESDVALAGGVQAGAFKAYHCKNNLWDMATPIEVGGKQVGNIYIGQFFYRDEEIDYERFRSMARRYGFDEEQYISALDRVPRFDRETVEGVMAFYSKLSAMISSLSYSTVALGRALAQKDRAMGDLKKSEERFRAVVENVPAGIFIQTDHQFAYLNEYAEKMFGVDSAARLIGQPVLERFHPDDHAQVLERIRQLNEKQQPVELAEERFLSYDGSTFVAEVSAVPFLYMGEKSALVFLRDITSRKRAEQALAVQARISEIFLTAGDDEMYNEILNAILDVMGSPFGVFGYLDEDGALVVPTMTREVWDRCRIPEKTFRFPREAWGDSSWPRAIRQKKPIYSNEPSSKIPEGHVVLTRHISLPIMEGKKVIGLFQVANKPADYTPDDVKTLQNIADHVAPILSARQARDRHEKNLQERNAELARFSYAVSHDLRSPLVTVKTFLGYLEKDLRKQDAERIASDFSFIRGAADKMARLLDELLDLTRVGWVDNPETIAPLQDIAREALGLVAGRIAERGVNVEVTQKVLVLRGDRPRLVEVFQNLIDNAVKFMGDQREPHIEIGMEKKNNEALLFVRDNGMGIDPRYQAKLFELFEKIDSSVEGTGIGLALVKRIVEVHGGRIWIESEGLGRGACIWFTLPGK